MMAIPTKQMIFFLLCWFTLVYRLNRVNEKYEHICIKNYTCTSKNIQTTKKNKNTTIPPQRHNY